MWQMQIVWKSLIAAAGWQALYCFVGDKVLLNLLPRKVQASISEKKIADPGVDETLRTNGVAFVHALISSLIAIWLTWGIQMTAEEQLCIGKTCILYQALGIIGTGYFWWDLWISIRQYHIYGFPFLLHAFVSLIGLLYNFWPVDLRMHATVLGYYLTEISTIPLHLRYGLIQGEANNSLYFTIANFLFIGCFVALRMVFVELFFIYPFMRDWMSGRITPTLPRKSGEVFMCVFWVPLNYFWGLALLRKQFRYVFGKSQKVRMD